MRMPRFVFEMMDRVRDRLSSVWFFWLSTKSLRRLKVFLSCFKLDYLVSTNASAFARILPLVVAEL